MDKFRVIPIMPNTIFIPFINYKWAKRNRMIEFIIIEDGKPTVVKDLR